MMMTSEVSLAVTLSTLLALTRGSPVAVLAARYAKLTITSPSRVWKANRSKNHRLAAVALGVWLVFDSIYRKVPKIRGLADDTLHALE
jgi:hypothetical protein